jgi:hypothetical protein
MRWFVEMTIDEAVDVVVRASSGALDSVDRRASGVWLGTRHPNLLVAGYAPVMLAAVAGGVEVAPQWQRVSVTNRLVWGAFGAVAALVSLCLVVMQLLSKPDVPVAMPLGMGAVMLGMGCGIAWAVASAQTGRARRDWRTLVAVVEDSKKR